MGSVSPLLAINKELKDSKALWVGTQTGIEKEVVEKAGIEYRAISSGKLRRYFDIENLKDLGRIIIGFFQALFIILEFRPDVIVSAGSFVAVPVVWAGWFNAIPCILHQQDIRPGLANKLMAPIAKKITVALEKSLNDYPKLKVALVGNPVRSISKIQETISKESSKFKFQNKLPILLVMGGGTGALSLNKIIYENLDELTKICNIIHLTGKGKCEEVENNKNYKVFEFLSQEELFPIMQDSDLVITRAGMSALTELAYFAKPAIIIPIPNSHQEDNAKYFAEKEAGVYLRQKDLTDNGIYSNIKTLLNNKEAQEKLSNNINKIFIDYSAIKIVNIIKNIKTGG